MAHICSDRQTVEVKQQSRKYQKHRDDFRSIKPNAFTLPLRRGTQKAAINATQFQVLLCLFMLLLKRRSRAREERGREKNTQTRKMEKVKTSRLTGNQNTKR